MITVFAIPKSYAGPVGLVQERALQSWLRFHPDVEIMLFGQDPGVAEIAMKYGVIHYPRIETTGLGTPILSSAFARAQEKASHSRLLYTNADIIFHGRLSDALSSVESYSPNGFLAVGYRTNAVGSAGASGGARFPGEGESELDEYLDWSRQRGELERGASTALDFFGFPRGQYPEFPPFAVGRPAWDNWMVMDARRRGLPVVDVSKAVTAIHPEHDYAHAGGQDAAWLGPEAEENRRLAGWTRYWYVFTLNDATHKLDKELRPRRRLSVPVLIRRIRQRLRLWRMSQPVQRWLLEPLRRARGVGKGRGRSEGGQQ